MPARLVVLACLALTAACGGEGKCLNPPCTPPDFSCASDADCFSTQFCDFPMNSCGEAVMDIGRCRLNSDCVEIDDRELTCGCDGNFHAGGCAVHRNGTDISADGGCSLPSGTFACGAHACDLDGEMCVRLVGLSDGTTHCEPLPDQCSVSPTCACLDNFSCGNCTGSTSAGFTIECEIRAVD
jgi:hypothetical protein